MNATEPSPSHVAAKNAGGFIAQMTSGLSAVTVLATILAMLVMYDQCESDSPRYQCAMFAFRILTDKWIPSVMYIYNKGSIAGPHLKIPFMGPFLESVNPKFESYHAKWATGALSCVSVFHKYGVRSICHERPCASSGAILIHGCIGSW